LLREIKNGRWKLRQDVIRKKREKKLRETNGDLKAAKDEIKEYKESLPAVTFAGLFSYRENDGWEFPSGLLPADLDNLDSDLPAVREKLRQSPHLFFDCESVSGSGLRAVFRIPIGTRPDEERYRACFEAVQQHVLAICGVEIDPACKDPVRLSFVCADRNARLNLEATPIALLPEKPEKSQASRKSKAATSKSNPRDSKPSKAKIREALGFIPQRPDYPDWFKLVAAVGDALPEADAIEVLNEWSPEEQEGEYAAKLRSGLKKIHVGTLFHIAKEYGWEPPTRKSSATELAEMAAGFDYFHDPQDRAFVRLEVHGHTEVWPVESSRFRKLLGRTYYKKTEKVVNRNALADAITILAGKVCYDGGEEAVFLRVAPHDENILIDLCDEAWRVVEVTPDGWRILDKSPVAFVRTGSMQSLPFPVQGSGSIAPLWKLLNVTKAQRPLVAGALLNHFHPRGPYFVLNFVGEQGTAKSYGAKIMRQLVDPNVNPLRSPPKEERDLMAQAANNWCVAFDNLSSLPVWLSDGLCRVSTGGGHSARTLYTDLEEISLAVKRPVILNGIEDVAARPDLAERALQIEMEEIGKTKRMKEEDLDKIFAEQKPAIFSAILDALVQALRNKQNVKLEYLPRMADAAIWATAGETAFGFKPGAFIAAYAKNLDESAIASVEAHPVGVAILKLLEKQDHWSGTATELLETLNVLASEE
jgi:hypothetical protein